MRHPITRPAARRFARRVGIADAVYGPRRYFLGDLFFSDLTGAPRNFGGGIDRHGGAVGRWLVTRDGFDFLFFYLYETDAAQHRAGDVLGAVEGADRGMGLLVEAAGGLERFLDRYAVVVVADHSQSAVLQAVDAAAPLEGAALFRSSRRSDPADCELAVTASNRVAMVYRLERAREPAARIADRMLESPAAELAMFAQDGWLVVRRGGGELRFRRGPGETDARGNRFTVAGDADLLHPQLHPNALERIEGALLCPAAGDVIVSAAPGYEYADSGGAHHAGGGSHGSLRAEDSIVPLITAGFEQRARNGPAAFDHRPGSTRQAPLRRAGAVGAGGVRVGRRPIASGRYGAGPTRVRRRPCAWTRPQVPSRRPPPGQLDAGSPLLRRRGHGLRGEPRGVPPPRPQHDATRSPSGLRSCSPRPATSCWNRIWTFQVRHGVPHHQYARFLTVSAMALCLDLVVLRALVEAGGMAKVSAAAIAILVATPVSFLGNKLWTFQ